MRKNAIVLFSLLATTMVLLFYSCDTGGRKKHIIESNPEFGNYIYGYTTGIISVKSPVTIRFRKHLKLNVQPGEVIEESLLEFRPKIDGKLYLKDETTIEFRPDGKMISGETYLAKLRLGKLFRVSGDLEVFEFQFRTIGQSFNVVNEGYSAYNSNDMTRNKLSGYVVTADVMDEDDIRKILSASQNGKELPLKWNFTGDTKKFPFTVDSIVRTNKAGNVILFWDGSPLNIKNKGTDTTYIPPIGEFTVLNANVIQQPEQYVEIRFSDPLKTGQNLKGLIRLKNVGDLRLTLENNIVKAYPPSRQSGVKTLQIEAAVKNIAGYKLKEPYSIELTFEKIKPAVRMTGKGVILPESNGLILPFEAVNLNAVDIEIVKIFTDNVLQYLQVNRMDEEYRNQLKRVARPILKKKISLTEGSTFDYGKWNAFSIDLTGLIRKEPGAIYQIEFSFKKEYSMYDCPGQKDETGFVETETEYFDGEDEESSWDVNGYYWDNYYPDGYDWRERDNPCHISYYNPRRWVSKMVLASNIGIIAKGGSGNVFKFAVTDLRTTEPLNGAKITIYNYQQQPVGEVTTGSDGFADIDLKKKPFVLVASYNDEIGYLRLDDGTSLSTSMFDVKGERVQKGIKGFIYGDRGVWRPGDTLFLNFILEDEKNFLPEGHPVTFELRNPQGQLVTRNVKTSGVNGFYNFTTVTGTEAQTGVWSAVVRVGGAVFTKRIRIETVKPNRLKIELDFDKEILSVKDKNLKGILKIRWLHGAMARNLKANVSVTLRKTRTVFENYEDYVFDDPTKRISADEEVIFDGKVNEEGIAIVKPDLGVHENAPGMLKAYFMVRAFEESGEFSTDFFSMLYAPYKRFVGLKLPEGEDMYWSALVTDSTYTGSVVTVDENGNPVSVDDLEVLMYKVRWRWWWDVSEQNLGNYFNSSEHELLMRKTVSTENGKGSFTFKVEYPEWGRYLIFVKDKTGKHSTGQYFYVDWPEWRSRSNRKRPEGAAVLAFSSDKEKYNVGEKAEVSFPTSGQGRALVSIENGSEILESFWIVPEPDKTETKFRFDITDEMCPNVYLYITYVQPHAQTVNDLPIRLYGVIPILVEDKNTRLYPLIDMPDELKPEKSFTVKVSEKNNKRMTYTLAIVDDGLLDLTRFRTPNPWSAFYAREALGVKTWDLYDYVLGAYGGKIEKMFAVGGDEGELAKNEQKANRFKPVVIFLGPFTLNGGTNEHKLKMPKYVGSVRAMVIAGNEGAYGSADKTVPVKNPLMILATLPRVLGPDEEVKLPVTVFAMDKKVKDVKLEVKVNELFNVQGERVKKVHFDRTGDKLVGFDLKVAEGTGIGKVTVVATGGGEKASYDIELDVRNPNPPETEIIETVLKPGESKIIAYKPVGIPGTNEGTFEISNIPPVDFGRRLKYLLQYPYGCAEQTTSAAFPQLYISDLIKTDQRVKDYTTKNVKEAIRALGFMQLGNGGLKYWPNALTANDWLTSYVGHFMLEAEIKGYSIPPGFKESWIAYQRKAARSWQYHSEKYPGYYRGYEFAQAYRLYTLALAGSPEMGAMNRLKEKGKYLETKWRLAAAYALAGQTEVAKSIVDGLSTGVEKYNLRNYVFGSALRDKAMILETMTILGQNDEAAGMVARIAKELSSQNWYSTQTTAFCLCAIGKYAGKNKIVGDELFFKYRIDNDDKKEVRTQLPISRFDLNIEKKDTGNVYIENKGKSLIYSRLVLQGIPAAGNETSTGNFLTINVKYTDLKGNAIDVTEIEQGTDFLAVVSVFNPGAFGWLQNMALTQIFPSGWEIINTRLAGYTSAYHADNPTYQDIRDDRVYTFFDIGRNNRKNFVVTLNASYLGKFYLPAVSCEAMYDNQVFARVPGRWVEVVKPGTK